MAQIWSAPSPSRHAALGAPTLATVAILAIVAVACRPRPGAPEPPPSTEFLVSAGDSTFWVRTEAQHLRTRRSPLTLANLDGRFYELYVADDDRSYFDALLIGQRIYRRDLLTGDSVAVFEDRRVSRMARAYAEAHPREEPLKPDEDGSDDPHTVATSDAEVLDVVGPFLSYEHHLDVDIAYGEDSHRVRHGVIDLRDGTPASLERVVGDSAARRVIADARAAYRVVIDSVRRSDGTRGHRATRAIDSFRFDSTSFTLEEIDGAPMIGFYVPGAGTAEGMVLPLPHVRTPEPAWWNAIRPTLPRLGADSLSEIWTGPRYDVVARYDTSGEFATLLVRDSAQREWAAGRLPTPARRVYRLDTPPIDSAVRRALARAFDESTLYSGIGRTVRGAARVRAPYQLVRRAGMRGARSHTFSGNVMRSFTAPDGTTWTVKVQSPGSSNAMVVFVHPDGRTARYDRYAWYISHGAEAHDVTARLDRRMVLDSLDDTTVSRLFRRSMPISTNHTPSTAPGGRAPGA